MGRKRRNNKQQQQQEGGGGEGEGGGDSSKPTILSSPAMPAAAPVTFMLCFKDLLILGTATGRLLKLNPKDGSVHAFEFKETTQHTGPIRCLSSLVEKDLLVSCADDRGVIVWDVNQEIPKGRIHAKKRPLGACFSADGNAVLVGTVCGDVHHVAIDALNGPTRYLLGHISCLTHLCLSNDGKYVVTADRDEKIRVSCYPQSAQIQSFCLGHSEAVSQVLCIPNRGNQLLSSGYDGTVRLWDMLTGTQISKFECPKNEDGGAANVVTMAMDAANGIIAVGMMGGLFHLLSLKGNDFCLIGSTLLNSTAVALTFLDGVYWASLSSAETPIRAIIPTIQDGCCSGLTLIGDESSLDHPLQQSINGIKTALNSAELDAFKSQTELTIQGIQKKQKQHHSETWVPFTLKSKG